MSDARPIGDYLPGILARAERMAKFQSLLNDMASDIARKKMIVAAAQGDLISAEDTHLLIQAYGLEEA